MNTKLQAVADQLATKFGHPVIYEGVDVHHAHGFRIGVDLPRRLYLAAELVDEWDTATILGLLVARKAVVRLRSAPGAAVYMDGWELRALPQASETSLGV